MYKPDQPPPPPPVLKQIPLKVLIDLLEDQVVSQTYYGCGKKSYALLKDD